MKYILFIIAVITNSSAWGQQLLHITQDHGSVKSPTSAAIMTTRIKEAAIQYQQYKPVPRIAQFDYAFAANAEEHAKLNAYGILYITSLNQDEKEQPIKRIYFKTADREIELVKLSEVKVPVLEKEIKEVFGEHRVDYYYLIPYPITQTEGSVFIDWSINRKDFKMCSFPGTVKLDFIQGSAPVPDKNKKIDDAALAAFLKREFQLTVN